MKAKASLFFSHYRSKNHFPLVNKWSTVFSVLKNNILAQYIFESYDQRGQGRLDSRNRDLLTLMLVCLSRQWAPWGTRHNSPWLASTDMPLKSLKIQEPNKSKQLNSMKYYNHSYFFTTPCYHTDKQEDRITESEHRFTEHILLSPQKATEECVVMGVRLGQAHTVLSLRTLST